ncbi:MAG TPA: hypothetical protein VNO79_12580 [Actinomycetota bacterium]|nr:hypothetical protein [Actinomycetota bacterium]
MATCLSKVEFLDEVMAHLSEAISEVIALRQSSCGPSPGPAAAPRSSSSPEIRVEMGNSGSSARLASWAGTCPGNDESAGKHR